LRLAPFTDESVTVPRKELVAVCPTVPLALNKHTTTKNEQRPKRPLVCRRMNYSFSAPNFVVGYFFCDWTHALWLIWLFSGNSRGEKSAQIRLSTTEANYLTNVLGRIEV